MLAVLELPILQVLREVPKNKAYRAEQRLTDARHPGGMWHDPHHSAGPSTERCFPAAAPALRFAASSAAALDTEHLPRCHSTPAAVPLPPLTLVPCPSPPSCVRPPPSPLPPPPTSPWQSAPLSIVRKRRDIWVGTRWLNAQKSYLTIVVTFVSTTAGLPRPSTCPPPPPPGCFSRARRTSTTTGRT